MKMKIVGGVVAMLGLAVAAIGWRISSNKNKNLSRFEVISLLSTLRIEYYDVMKKIAQYVEGLASKGIVPNQETKKMIQIEFKEQLNEIHKNVFTTISEQEFEEAIENTFKDDKEITLVRKQFIDEYAKCFLGVKPEREITIPRRINKALLLQSVQQILSSKLKRVKQMNLKEKNEQAKQKILQEDTQEDERVIKQILKSKLGLQSRDSINIFEFSIAKYSAFDEQFKKKYETIKNEYTIAAQEQYQQYYE